MFPLCHLRANLGLSLLHNSQLTFEVAHAAGKFLRGDISHRREHRDATMLELSLTTALEVLYAAISCESGGVPKSHRSLNTQLILERAQWRSGVVGPVTPRASGESIL